MSITILKSIAHNIGVLIVGFVFALIGVGIDYLLGISPIHSTTLFIVGLIFLLIGFLIRVWATYYFYAAQMNVIVLAPQQKLITDGPYRFSRNPLYLGGNVFIFFGAVFALGSPSGIALSIIAIFVTDLMIRREEKQLQQKFGHEWLDYKKRVRRWV